MKQVVSLLAFLAVLAVPVGVCAQGAPYPFPNSITIGSNYTSGLCVTTGSAGVLQDTTCSGGGSGAPFIPVLGGNGDIIPTTLANTTFTGNQVGVIPVGMHIGHINVSCDSYNVADATAGNSNYTPLNSNGLGGATITFSITNGTYSGSSPFNLGTVIIPTSPMTGPWVTTVTSTVGSPYSVLSGDMLEVLVSSTSGTAAQWAQNCMPFVGP